MDASFESFLRAKQVPEYFVNHLKESYVMRIEPGLGIFGGRELEITSEGLDVEERKGKGKRVLII